MKNYVLLLAVGSLLLSCKKEQPQGTQAMPFPVVTVVQKDITVYQEFPAKIEGRINNQVRAKIQGYIKEVYVDEGQTVKKGQSLFRLETNTLNQSAEASKANIQVAQVEVDKLTPLVEKGIISPVQLETAKANLLQAKAAYNNVLANIDYSVIKSPVNGIVGELPFKTGSLVGPSDPTPLTTVSDTEEIYVYFSMNESKYLDFLQQTKGETLKEKLSNIPTVQLVLANGAIYPQQGKIETVTGQINPQSGTVQFRATFPNENRLLTNGSSGVIRIPEYYKNATVVPEPSTWEQQGIIYVFGIKNNAVTPTVIDVQTRVDNMAIVISGVKPGDSIVAAGVGTLRAGTSIIPQPVKFDSIINIQPQFK